MKKLKIIFNRNNLMKTIHHLRNGNFSFVLNKMQQKAKEHLPHRQKVTKGTENIFDFMFKQNNTKYSEYKNFTEHTKVEDTIKTIAFYLPQFHPIDENDKNWGKGFTEWTNVSKAIPQFYGHYQPKLPGELGFYDLRLNEIQHRQVELAKNYGIDGFCFHFYWFNAKRVLEKPLEVFVNDKSIDFPFCINWANENWTRRWDGLEGDILLEQKYSDEDDLEFIETVSQLFKDSRYIRVDGKPLLMIYRVSLFPDIQATVKRWREYCIKEGIGEIYLVLTHSFEHENPEKIGFDAAVEFSPNTFSVPVQNSKQYFYNQNYNGMVFDYDDAVNYSLDMNTPKYKKFKTLFPSWDNEARKPGAGTSFIGSSAKKYEQWLTKLYKYTKENLPEKEQLLFINAWNEWAEGAYLEPDRKFGYAYLEATYRAKAFYNVIRKKIILISHDAYLHGAQYLALNIARELSEVYKYEVSILLNGDGPLLQEFEKFGTVYKLYEMSDNSRKELYQTLYGQGIRHAIANTSTVGNIVKDLHAANIQSISLIHEMANVIKQMGLENSVKQIATYADTIIFPSNTVKKDFKQFTSLDEEKIFVQPQGLFRHNKYKNTIEKAREKLRVELGIEKDTFIVLNIAYGDKRKGMDIFVKSGIEILERGHEVHFLWGGHYEENLYMTVSKIIQKSGYQKFFHFTGFLKDIDYFYAGSDLFFLSSREDPFPSVVMDAMNVGLPVVGFKDAGGFGELLKDDNGILVKHLDIEDASSAIIDCMVDKEKYQLISNNAERKIDKDYDFSKYISKLIHLSEKVDFKVSVIIPNYNYARYIQERIESVLMQTYPIHEIIFLDDNSSDDSIQLAEQVLSISKIPYKVIKNEVNSGSVFKQWAKGINEASGDCIWIAEADDLCESTFLENVMKGFINKDTVISYTQSKMIDTNGVLLAYDYLEYTNDIDKEKWKSDYHISGDEELRTSMVVKNIIPNVSAVVFKKIDIHEVLDKLTKFKVAGDWFFYSWLLKKGYISYIAKSLNLHRRHKESVTGSLDNQKHYDEIEKMQHLIANRLNIDDEVMKKSIRYKRFVKKHLGIK